MRALGAAAAAVLVAEASAGSDQVDSRADPPAPSAVCDNAPQKEKCLQTIYEGRAQPQAGGDLGGLALVVALLAVVWFVFFRKK